MNKLVTERQELVANKKLFISCVVPVHNEQAVVTQFINTLSKELEKLTSKYEIIIVDDGSSDTTLLEIESLLANTNIKLIALSRNFGKENALTAGIEHSNGDVTVLIDADFQHPVKLIKTFIEYWAKGHDMVYGVRKNRENESCLKRAFTSIFYLLIAKISRVNIPANAGDFRLLDKKVINALKLIPERGRFMKGLYAWVGFNTIGIPFTVENRKAGTTSWKFNRLTELAITGITSFSDIPLKVWSLIGFIMALISFAYASYIIIEKLFLGINIPGYATIVVAIMFFGGIQLFSIGILGEYIGRIFTEVKQRPKYIIAKKHGFK